MADFYDVFGERILIEINPWLSVVRTQMSPPYRAVRLGRLHAGPPSNPVSLWYLGCLLFHMLQDNMWFEIPGINFTGCCVPHPLPLAVQLPSDFLYRSQTTNCEH